MLAEHNIESKCGVTQCWADSSSKIKATYMHMRAAFSAHVDLLSEAVSCVLSIRLNSLISSFTPT